MRDGAAAARVARYYDDNTGWFLRFDPSRSRVIHRPVWADGVRDVREAAHHVHQRIAQARPDARRLLDLGCGVGESVFWLSERLELERAVGVTISELQQEIAARSARARGMGRTCAFFVRDFTELGEIGAFDLAIAIESFGHGVDPTRFFAEAARVVTPGGSLFVCDDFVVEAAPTAALDLRREACLARLRRGWHLHSLIPRSRMLALAEARGFVHASTHVLTPCLKLLPDAVLSALARIGDALERLPSSSVVDNLVGGTALQESQRRGYTEYALVQLTRAP